MAEANRSMNKEVRTPRAQSAQFWAILKKHLAIFSELYRQPVSELAVIAYAEDLCGLSPEQLDAACLEARRTSEFMPVPAKILSCVKHEEQVFLGPRLVEYAPVAQEEREDALKFSEQLKKTLLKK